MPRMLRFVMFLLGGLALLLLAVLLCIYLALRHEPSFYRKALTIDRKVLEKGSDRMLQNFAALQSALSKRGHWKIRFTAEEINGWLAVDLMKNHPGALPEGLSDPRVAITPRQIAAACQYDGSVKAVLNLAVKPYLAEPNVVALRVNHARAGMVPLPLNKVLDAVSLAAGNLRLKVEWRNTGSDPVAMLSLPDDDDGKLTVRIESIQLAEGEFTVAGTTERKKR
jgi:hypothetical protein